MPGKIRVSELAKELGITSKEALAKLVEMGEYVKSASSTVEPSVARAIRELVSTPSMIAGPDRTSASTSIAESRSPAEIPMLAIPQQVERPDANIESLIRVAFEQAKSAGNPTWNEMTTAVLKNRLLSITNRRFKETDYGARDMKAFVQRFPGVIELLPSQITGQPRVRLRGEAAEVVAETVPTAIPKSLVAAAPMPRIRPDLWRAAVDFASGQQYVWDHELQVARAGDPGPDAIRFPTVTPEEVHAWRMTFFDQYWTDLAASEKSRVGDWLAGDLSTAVLPARLRGPWNGFYRSRVVEKVRTFFEDANLKVPADLVTTGTTPLSTASAHDPEARRLRQYLIECLELMTVEEMRGLPIPADVAYRAGKKR